MEALIFIALLAAGSWLSTYYCIKKKKFYHQSVSKVSGQVISWSKHKEFKAQYRETYYDIDVLGENGETYSLSISSRKARKYKHKQDIVILVPDGLQKSEESGYLDELIEKEKSNTLNELEKVKLKGLCQIEETRQQISNTLNEESKNMIKIEEEIESSVELCVS